MLGIRVSPADGPRSSEFVEIRIDRVVYRPRVVTVCPSDGSRDCRDRSGFPVPRPGSIYSGPHGLQLRYDFVIAPELQSDCELRWDWWYCFGLLVGLVVLLSRL